MKTKYDQSLENRLSDALEWIDTNPGVKIARVARDFNIPRGQLRSRLEGHSASTEQIPSTMKFTPAEEKALCRYIDRLDAINLQVRKEFVVDAANAILKEKANKADKPHMVGKHWATRFLKRHEYSLIKQKVLEQNRKVAEDPKVVGEWFEKLRKVILDEGILEDDIYNMDETGFRIGVGKDQFVVTKKKQAGYFGLPNNRESATVIEAIRGNGEVIAPFIILSGITHMGKWYGIPTLPTKASITLSPSGFANDEISLAWLKHFNSCTNEGRRGHS